MKTYIKFIILCLLPLLILSTANAVEKETIKLVIQSPITIGKTKVALSKIVSLSSKAIQVGYDEIMLKGSVKYKRLANKRTRVNINWSSLKKEVGTSERNFPLKTGLVSQFIIDDKRVDTGVELSAEGDLENLSKSLDEALTSVASSGGNQGAGSDEENDNASNTNSAQKVNSPSSASVDGGYSDPTSNSESANTGTSGSGATLTVTSYESCAPRIDKAGGMVYEQAQKVTTLETGEEQSRESCADKGATASIVKSYDSCGVLEDIQNGSVYKKYKETADLNGKSVIVTDCTVDFTQKYTVKNDYSVCSMRHDFVNGESIQQEQFYYLDDTNTRIDLGDCVDSSVSYAHSLTLNTCTATVDEVNGYVFPQKRVMYTTSNGTVEYASGCAPVTSEQVALSAESCPQKYEHDFTAGQSYKRIQSFYNDFQTNEKILVGVCSRDTTISYPHIHEQASCTTEYDDANLMNKWNSNTQIDLASEGEGVLEIAPCAQYGNPTPYLFVTTGYKLSSSVNDSVYCQARYIGDPASSFSEAPATSISISGKTWNSGGTVSTALFTTNSSIQTWGTQCSIVVSGFYTYNLNTKHYNWTEYRRYKRGDNTLYDSPTGVQQLKTGSTPRAGVNTL